MSQANSLVVNPILVSISVLIYFLIVTKNHYGVVPYLFIEAGNSQNLISVFNGQIWRLLTPVFIHFSFIHLFLNIVALLCIGNVIEKKIGSANYLLVILVISIFSNAAQFYLTHSKWFGGLSGIIYGLIAYMWIRSKEVTAYRFVRSELFLTIFFLAYLMNWFDVFGKTANWSHTFGLIIGVVFGHSATLNDEIPPSST